MTAAEFAKTAFLRAQLLRAAMIMLDSENPSVNREGLRILEEHIEELELLEVDRD